MDRVQCRHCDHRFSATEADRDGAGETARCPSCGASFDESREREAAPLAADPEVLAQAQRARRALIATTIGLVVGGLLVLALGFSRSAMALFAAALIFVAIARSSKARAASLLGRRPGPSELPGSELATPTELAEEVMREDREALRKLAE